jgi:septal ring factor EnvC (AmiA/AmiB activator)
LNKLLERRKLAPSRREDMNSSRSGRSLHKENTIHNLGAQEAHQRYIEERKEKEKLDQQIIVATEVVEQLRRQYSESMGTVHRLEREISDIKPEIAAITKKQLDFYYDLLAIGKETRGQGLTWTIKTIWYLKGNVQPNNLPKALDPESVNYLLEYARLSIERAELVKKLKDVKVNIYARSKDSILTSILVH